MNIETLRPIARTLLRSYEVRSARSVDLATAIIRGKPTSWSDGEVLCTEGEPSEDMFIILKGSVRIMRNDAQGNPRELAILKAPTMIGQMGLVDGSVRSATCIAKERVGSLTIDTRTFKNILEDATSASSAFRHLLLASMNMQLSTANSKIRSLIEDIEQEVKEKNKSKETAAQTPKASSSDRLMEIAGVLDGWKMDSRGVDDVQFVEDEDMKRTREARAAKKY
jgi:CRP-like cAMP-binding protein